MKPKRISDYNPLMAPISFLRDHAGLELPKNFNLSETQIVFEAGADTLEVVAVCRYNNIVHLKYTDKFPTLDTRTTGDLHGPSAA